MYPVKLFLSIDSFFVYEPIHSFWTALMYFMIVCVEKTKERRRRRHAFIRPSGYTPPGFFQNYPDFPKGLNAGALLLLRID